MIFDTLENAAFYGSLNPLFEKAFRFLQKTDLANLPVGRIDLEGDALYALVQEYTTRDPEQGNWEAHRNYIDIQYVVSGAEKMGFANLKTMDLGEYVPERDFQALSGKGNEVAVFAGSFAVFFPQDAHLPGKWIGNPAPVRKVVFKVKVGV